MIARFAVSTHFRFSYRTLCPFLLFPKTSYQPQTATHECTVPFRTFCHLSLLSTYFPPSAHTRLPTTSHKRKQNREKSLHFFSSSSSPSTSSSPSSSTSYRSSNQPPQLDLTLPPSPVRKKMRFTALTCRDNPPNPGSRPALATRRAASAVGLPFPCTRCAGCLAGTRWVHAPRWRATG